MSFGGDFGALALREVGPPLAAMKRPLGGCESSNLAAKNQRRDTPLVLSIAMAGGVDREHVFETAEELGWRIAERPNKKGYLKMWCPCGAHLRWLHKTPSGVNYYRDVIAWMRRICEDDRPAKL